MKLQLKPIIVFAASAFLFVGMLSQSATAQGVWTSNTVSLAAANNNSADALSVQYIVDYDGAGTFTYNYSIFNPSTDPATVATFEISFDSLPAGAVESHSGGTAFIPDGPTGVTWGVHIAPGSSTTLTLTSLFSPSPTTGNASGDIYPSPWASIPNGQTLVAPNPPVVPEPATMTLFGLTALGALFRPKFLRKK